MLRAIQRHHEFAFSAMAKRSGCNPPREDHSSPVHAATPCAAQLLWCAMSRVGGAGPGPGRRLPNFSKALRAGDREEVRFPFEEGTITDRDSRCPENIEQAAACCCARAVRFDGRGQRVARLAFVAFGGSGGWMPGRCELLALLSRHRRPPAFLRQRTEYGRSHLHRRQLRDPAVL